MNFNALIMGRCKSFVSVVFLLAVFGSAFGQVNPYLLTHAWDAHWIGYPGKSRQGYGVYHFRQRFPLAARPGKFIIHITADNRYRLFVNGEAIGLGPARGDKLHWRYDTYDLAAFLHSGENVLAVEVWDMGDDAPVAQLSVQTGLLIQGDTEQEAVINTGVAGWKVCEDKAYRPYHVTPEMVQGQYYALGARDSVDAGQYPWGWETVAFDDAGWVTPAVSYTGKPVYLATDYGDGTANLQPRTIPYAEVKKERLARVIRAIHLSSGDNLPGEGHPLVIAAGTTATLLLDQGYLTSAYPELWTSGGKGSSIDIGYAESLFDDSLHKGNRNETRDKKLVGYHDAFLPDGGRHRLFRPLWYRTWRYLELTIHTGDEPLAIDDLYGMFTAYPFEQHAAFITTDTLLKKIWEVGWRTARLCANETYMDCPYYEQLQYIGDARIQALISLHVSGDDRLMRNALELYNYSRLPEGITQSRYPSSLPQMIPPFTLYWIDMVHDYYRYRKDDAFIRQFLPGIRDGLFWFESHLNKDSLLSDLGWWNFVDWADQYNANKGVPRGVEDGKGSSVLSLEYVYALERAAALFEHFGQGQEARRYRALAKTVRQAVYRLCYDSRKQLFGDTPEKDQFSQHANVMAILTDAVPAGGQAALMKRLLADSSLVQCTIYYQFYLLEALKKAGMGDDYLEHLKPWKSMLDQGLTTFAETDKDPRSDCHAWSASPLIGFLNTVCGIEPGAPGFATVVIAPRLGRLREVSGVMPHPAGDIAVRMKRKGEAGLWAEIQLPPGVSGLLTWNDKKIALHGGRQQISIE